MKNLTALSFLALGIISSYSQAQNVVQNARKAQQDVEKQIEQLQQNYVAKKGAKAYYMDGIHHTIDLGLSIWAYCMAKELKVHASIHQTFDSRIFFAFLNLMRSGLMAAYAAYSELMDINELHKLRNEVAKLEDFIKEHEKFGGVTENTGVTGKTVPHQKEEV